jgi:hypothetical protein
MNDAITQRVERFVREILGLIEQARGESRAAALSVVSTMLADVGRPPRASASSRRGSPRSYAGSTSPKAAASPVSDTGGTSRKAAPPRSAPTLRRRAESTAMPMAVASSSPANTSNGAAGPATQRSPRPITIDTGGTSPSPANSPSETVTPAPEREALVLDAVRALVRATASEVAGRSGQPNGSVGVALRALVARGQVAKTRTARGVEYSLVSTGSIQPFKRTRRGGATSGPGATVGDAPVGGGSPNEQASAIAVA